MQLNTYIGGQANDTAVETTTTYRLSPSKRAKEPPVIMTNAVGKVKSRDGFLPGKLLNTYLKVAYLLGVAKR